MDHSSLPFPSLDTLYIACPPSLPPPAVLRAGKYLSKLVAATLLLPGNIFVTPRSLYLS
ncbi:hypothetical protein E2C01_093020 [Portunus trituberculatus]|uniref:Uncharacterized protein n=1 Tax=Portunus trituberculatus TaxID=210409 RepID=A0A5B7JZG5_PORTR|nr:hypothetical protein [Portunus trituberculatus]